MNEITDKLIMEIASKIKDQPAEFSSTVGQLIDNGASEELQEFLDSSDETIRDEVKEMLDAMKDTAVGSKHFRTLKSPDDGYQLGVDAGSLGEVLPSPEGMKSSGTTRIDTPEGTSKYFKERFESMKSKTPERDKYLERYGLLECRERISEQLLKQVHVDIDGDSEEIYAELNRMDEAPDLPLPEGF